MNHLHRLTIVVLLLVGSGLRWQALARDLRFHPDEALFSTFARAAAIKGDWLLPGALDKPPLAIYANALAQVFVGPGEFAARLPGTFAGIVLLALLYGLAKRLYPGQASVPLLTLLLAACSPFAIAFSPTALTDGLMLALMVAALWAVAGGYWLWGGIWLGLSFASKQQGIYYLPLVLLVGLLMTTTRTGQNPLQAMLRFVAGFGLVLAGLLLWDVSRAESSIFALAASNNAPGRFIRADEILPRLAAWGRYASLLLGYGWLTGLLLGVAAGGLAYRIRRQAAQPGTTLDVLLVAYALAYGWLHWLVAFNTYDRYLLPLLPVVLVLVARGLSLLAQILNPARVRVIAVALLSSVLLLGGIQASRGAFPLHHEGEQYRGIDEVADFLSAQPVATVIYDHWLGWQMDYYLGVWHDKRRVYYPNPQALVADALRLCENGTRYLPVPRGQPHQVWLEALGKAGFGIRTALETEYFRVYGLTPPWSRVDAVGAEAAAPGQSHRCDDAPP